MRWIISIYLILIFINVHAQSDSTYQILIAKANLLHLQKNYKNAIPLFERAFKIQRPDALTAYKAAGMYSLSNNSEKGFQYLKLAISAGWTEAEWLISDPYFDYLKATDQREWNRIKEEAYNRERVLENNISLPVLRKEINLLTLNDQMLRYKRVQAANDSIRLIIDQLISQSDLKNLNTAKEIISQYGWPKKSQIGRDGQNNLWLIVQHADQDVVFQKAALLAMQKLLGTKDIDLENFAFLYDRVQCNLNYKQLYGTQVLWKQNGEASGFRPILQEYNVDKRREKLGLQLLHVYSQSYGFNYCKSSLKQSNEQDSVYGRSLNLLLDSAKSSYEQKDFSKTYDYYNNASAYLGGMNDEANFKAAVIFSTIANEDKDDKYSSIALDFLDLLFLRNKLTKCQLVQENSFKVLYKDQRWLNLYNALN